MFPTKFSPEQITKNMIELISSEYSYLVIRQAEFEKAKAIFQSKASDVFDHTDLINLAIEALSQFGDGHMEVVDAQGNSLSTRTSTRPINYSRQISDGYLSEVKKNGPITIGTIEDMAYVGIDAFNNEKAFKWLYKQKMPTEEKFIIDLRANGGGKDSLGNELVSFLQGTQGPLISSYLRFRTSKTDPTKLTPFRPKQLFPSYFSSTKQVVVLTGGGTYSSGENITMDLAAIPGTILIGEVTGGGSGCPKRYLADGPNAGKAVDYMKKPENHGARFALDIPSWLDYRLDQRLLEGNGIEPHITIPAQDSIRDRRDLVLEKAVEVLTNTYIAK